MNINILMRPMAYLDPGTGSFVIQMVLAGLLGVAVVVRVYWKKITKIFNKKNNYDELEEIDQIDEYGDDVESLD